MLALSDEDVFVLVGGLAADLAHPFWGVVPVDGVCGYVVGAGLPASLSSSLPLLGAVGGIFSHARGYAQRQSHQE